MKGNDGTADRWLRRSGLALALALGALLAPRPAPAGFASPINGGCYIAGPNDCRIHVDPFVININDGGGAKLILAQIYANGALVYDFRTDVSNPPGTDYYMATPALDFGARCGETFYVNLIAQDTTDANPLNYGQTAEFTCPAGVPTGTPP
jgi:hypothetical protein